MADHAMFLMTNPVMTPVAMRSHIFDYIMHANRLTTEQALVEFALESIPEAEEADLDIINDRINNETDQDMYIIQDIMFRAPILFTAAQAWNLATVVIAHQRDESIRQRITSRPRNVAVMMAAHARLGAGSSLSELETLILRDIVELSMQP
jgi:hypothetical protein